MGNALNNFDGVEIFFLICAFVGGVFVIIRLALQFVGADHDLDMDTDIDIEAHHVDSDLGFKLLSLQGLTAFLMMFGLVGLAFYRESKTGLMISVAGGAAAGLISVWIIAKLFSIINKLQSSGTMKLSNAIGSEGSVYLTIPKDGTGRVTVTFNNRLREFDAISENKEEIKTGDQIRVVKVSGNAMVVEKQ